MGFFTTPSFSHQQTFRALCKELALRGHYVTFISPDILNEKSIKNLKEIDLHQTYDLMRKKELRTILSRDLFTIKLVMEYHRLCGVPNEIAFEVEKLQQLITNGETFDLLIIQVNHPLTYAIASKFKAPVIGK